MGKPVRILHIVGAMYPGGYENFIMNLYENIDREKLQFDIAVHARKENDYVEKIEEMGGRVYVLDRLTKHPIRSLRSLYRIVKNNRYPVVIRHTPNAMIAPELYVSKKAGAYTICHSHNETDPKKALHEWGKKRLKKCVSERVACSLKAGEWMFGEDDFTVIHNAIDTRRFSYSPQKAQKVIEEFHLEGKHIYGHIANFIASKNHLYLLEVFKEITQLDEQAVLLCLGEGDLRPEIEAKIKELHLEDKVILTGIRKDPENFMSAFEVLLFPSKFEGLPLTLIEAQSAGLRCLISDTVTKDVIVTKNLVEQKSITLSPKEWAERAVVLCQEKKDRSLQFDSIAAAGYDIHELCNWFTAHMMEIVDGIHNQ